MNLQTAGNDELPVYDSLVRERGDVVAETRSVAEEAQIRMAQALSGHGILQPAPDQMAPQPTAPADGSTGVG
ncbi:hypothetical protein [Streptomyces sp. NPDC046821]|uniref:hypothetical protein n=1 Tax=Streptomyces sp. NPDC046821 TaxID=3154702 RepID=UPI0033F33143